MVLKFFLHKKLYFIQLQSFNFSFSLAKFLSERAQASIEYAKKLKEISLKHQQKYNNTKVKHLPWNKDLSTNAVFVR